MIPSRVVAIGLLLLLQGPALLVQEVAWVRMLVTYSQQQGIKRGVVETFDGEHPCPLCAKAAALRQKERSAPPGTPVPGNRRALLAWGEMLLGTRVLLPAPEAREIRDFPPAWQRVPHARAADQPPSPPPERAA